MLYPANVRHPRAGFKSQEEFTEYLFCVLGMCCTHGKNPYAALQFLSSASDIGTGMAIDPRGGSGEYSPNHPISVMVINVHLAQTIDPRTTCTTEIEVRHEIESGGTNYRILDQVYTYE